LLGRIVPAEAVNMLLDKLGIGDRIALSPEQLVDAALGGKVVPIDALSGTSLKRSASTASSGLRSSALIPRFAFVEGQRLLHRDHRLSDPAVHAGEQRSRDRGGTGGLAAASLQAAALRAALDALANR
jgi:hypothetical protein